MSKNAIRWAIVTGIIKPGIVEKSSFRGRPVILTERNETSVSAPISKERLSAAKNHFTANPPKKMEWKKNIKIVMFKKFLSGTHFVYGKFVTKNMENTAQR